MKILVVGMGLIGGSFCKAIKKYTAHHMIGMDSDEATIDTVSYTHLLSVLLS